MAQPVVVALVCSTLVFIHFAKYHPAPNSTQQYPAVPYNKFQNLKNIPPLNFPNAWVSGKFPKYSVI